MCSSDLRKWASTLGALVQVKIPRHITVEGDHIRRETHTFCDASAKAYAAVVFMRSESRGEGKISLLASKSRVPLLKMRSIPRLELLGCCIGAQLTNSITNAYSNQFSTFGVIRQLLLPGSRGTLSGELSSATKFEKSAS